MTRTAAIVTSLAAAFALSIACGHAAEQNAHQIAADWISRFAFSPPPTGDGSGRDLTQGALPSFTVVPAATGRQLVRVSLPFPPGAFPQGVGLILQTGGDTITPDVRRLTHHPGQPRSARRAIVTFPYAFADLSERVFRAQTGSDRRPPASRPAPTPTIPYRDRVGDLDVALAGSGIEIGQPGNPTWRAVLMAPICEGTVPPTIEVIERGTHYLWARLLVPDPRWPRILELRADSLGTVAVRAHLQRLDSGDAYCPDLGWRFEGPAVRSLRVGQAERKPDSGSIEHRFDKGEGATVVTTAGCLLFPDAPLLQRGSLDVVSAPDGRGRITYVRCRESDRVPHQEAAWRTATFVLSLAGAAPWNALLEPPHEVRVPGECFDAVYQCGRPADVSSAKVLADVLQYHRHAIGASAIRGDDFGNITSFPAAVFGMNRLNHCPPIFDEYYRSGDARLREAALQWCDNFYDLSIWWGTTRENEFGGTRYNNASLSSGAHKDDSAFMWRSNTAVSFCTKGIDTFLYAYEETGDPRMATALRWQIEYARSGIHADMGECRNIGDVLDFVRLYRSTGRREHLDQALRLFRELRTKLSDGDLFDQGGKPLDKDPPFIDEDARGLKVGYAKPYIIGYALAGLPDLAREAPDEPKLKDVVRAVADFLVESQDPLGGWRYPHPRSSYLTLSQAIEHARQITQAAKLLGPDARYLDAIERVLRQRILVWRKTGTVLSGLSGWELATGRIKEAAQIYDLYKRPADRDASRDYIDGRIGVGTSPPEGLVYFPEVLAYYLQHRPAERLLKPPTADEPLAKVLGRLTQEKP